MLLERHRGVRVLVLTSSRDRELMMRAVRLGVHGYLRKGAETADISRAVHALLRGESVFDSRTGSGGRRRAARRRPAAGPRAAAARCSPSGRTRCCGCSRWACPTARSARRLVISEATVKFHVRNLRDKLEVRRRTEIVYTATRQGIV